MEVRYSQDLSFGLRHHLGQGPNVASRLIFVIFEKSDSNWSAARWSGVPKNARIEGNDNDHEARKKARVEELKEKSKRSNKKRTYNRNKKKNE